MRGAYTSPAMTVGDQQQTDAMEQSFAPASNSGVNAGIHIAMPITENMQPWHQFVTQDLRNHLVFKLLGINWVYYPDTVFWIGPIFDYMCDINI